MSNSRQHTTVVWREGMSLDATTTTGHHIRLDAASERGPRPNELMLTALAGCTAMDVLSILQKKREPVAGLEVSVAGTRADEHPRIYTDVQVVYRVRGNVRPESVARAIELSETRYCSAHALLSKSARITSRFEIEAAPPEMALA